LVSPGAAAPGDPDPTFGAGGTATDFVNGVTIRDVVLQPDGKIIVVGSKKLTIQIGEPPKDYLFIRRYTATGVLETTFNTTLKQGIGYDAEVQPDGKVVVIGQAPNTVTSPFGVTVNTTSPVVWRFNGNGTLDTNFGSNGARFVNAQSGGNLGIEVFNTYIVITYASRNLFLLGDYSYKVSRLTQNGSFDYTMTLPFPYAQYADVTVMLDPLTSDIVALGKQRSAALLDRRGRSHELWYQRRRASAVLLLLSGLAAFPEGYGDTAGRRHSGHPVLRSSIRDSRWHFASELKRNARSVGLRFFRRKYFRRRGPFASA
jgi:uncharacterized delta-60 repeat protein